MAWTDDMVTMLRGLINDMSEPYTYEDGRLETLLALSAVFVMQEVDFSAAYTINIATPSISPDPVDNNDVDFQALVCLRTACMITSGEFKVDAAKGVAIKDGPSSIDLSGRIKAREQVAKQNCDNYERARVNYQIGDGSLGRAIVGPYGGVTDNTSGDF